MLSITVEAGDDYTLCRPEGELDAYTVGTFREAAGITRKHAVPLLAELDHRGVTRRRGDLRIAGNRLPAV